MDTTPLLVQDDRAVRLLRVPFDERRFDEAWLQDLLFKHPSLIPVDEIEPIFAPLVPVARELPTPSGPLDILYVSPEGYLTLVETKLWRNPGARRQVVAQAVDYAAQLSKWSYEELTAAVRKCQPKSAEGDPFVNLMEGHGEEWDEADFIDAVSANLRRGRMLLLIVGDGIHEAVEHMAETLSRTPQLGFTLGLVEMCLFRPLDRSEPLIVQPRIVLRTREVVRAIVELRAEVKPSDVNIKTPPGEESGDGPRVTLTGEEFLRKLAEESSQRTADELRGFLRDADSCGIKIVPRQASLSLHYFDPSAGRRFSFGSVYRDSKVDMFYVVYFCREAGIEGIARDYLDTVAQFVRAARVEVWETKGGLVSAIKVGDRHVTLDELLPKKAEWLAAIEHAIDRINKAADAVGLIQE